MNRWRGGGSRCCCWPLFAGHRADAGERRHLRRRSPAWSIRAGARSASDSRSVRRPAASSDGGGPRSGLAAAGVGVGLAARSRSPPRSKAAVRCDRAHPGTFVVVALLLALVALAGSYVPAGGPPASTRSPRCAASSPPARPPSPPPATSVPAPRGNLRPRPRRPPSSPSDLRPRRRPPSRPSTPSVPSLPSL